MRVQSRHNTSRKKQIKVIIIASFLVVLGMFVPAIISGVSAAVTYPVYVTNVWLNESSSLVPSFIRDRRELQSEIGRLENELVIAARIDLTQRRLVEENESLRKLLGIDEEVRTAAAVIARPDELPFDLLQIDRGSDQGIEVGAPVFIGRDIVIGLVAHTAPKYSFVQLITSPGFEATAFISGPNVVVAMEGVGGGVSRVKVPQGVSMSIEDLVYLPSVEPGVFGRISHIENRPTQPEQYGYITPNIAISGLYRVSVGSLSQISQSADQIDQSVLSLIEKQLVVEHMLAGTSSASSSSTANPTDN
jgi:cell shape-determining protein MreC